MASLRPVGESGAHLVVMVMETCASGSQSFGVPVHAEWWHSDMVSLARWIEDLLVVVIVVPRWLHAVWWSFGGRQQHGHGIGGLQKVHSAVVGSMALRPLLRLMVSL